MAMSFPAGFERWAYGIARSTLPNSDRIGAVLLSGLSNFIQTPSVDRGHISNGNRSQEDRQMWFYIQTGLPLLTIGLTAAICFSVASFIMTQSKPQS